jgi:hypothetical protein
VLGGVVFHDRHAPAELPGIIWLGRVVAVNKCFLYRHSPLLERYPVVFDTVARIASGTPSSAAGDLLTHYARQSYSERTSESARGSPAGSKRIWFIT